MRNKLKKSETAQNGLTERVGERFKDTLCRKIKKIKIRNKIIKIKRTRTLSNFFRMK